MATDKPGPQPKFKRLTPQNWAQPDPTSRIFGRLDPLRGPVRMDGDDWADTFLGVNLEVHVPDDIVDLFEVAKGILVYGWFFYPLFQVGDDQLHRAAEAAAKLRYENLTGRKAPRFVDTIAKLVELGAIDTRDEERWQAARHLRNKGSHHSEHVAMLPGMILGTLKATRDDINVLFPASPESREGVG